MIACTFIIVNNMSANKKCIKCGLSKPLDLFYSHEGMKDGRLNKCKECCKKSVSENYLKNIEHYKAYDKARAMLPHRVEAREKYSQTTKGKEKKSYASREWKKRNPIKHGATIIVGNAVRDGRLNKPPNCSNCNCEPSRLHGHHDDYAMPLVVRWLCPKCHKAWHADNGEGLNCD